MKKPESGFDFGFDVISNGSVYWFTSAQGLVAAANLCYKRFEHVHACIQRRHRAFYYPEFGLETVVMLYGFGLEGLLKALLVAQGHEAASAGKLTDKFKTHELQDLYDATGLPPLSSRERQVVGQMRLTLEFGRYPVRTTATQPRNLSRSLRQDHDCILDLLVRVDAAIREFEPIYWTHCDLRILGTRLIRIASSRPIRPRRKRRSPVEKRKHMTRAT